MRHSIRCVLLAAAVVLPACGPAKTGPPKIPAPPTAALATPTPALPPAPTPTPTPRGRSSPLFPVSSRAVAGGATLLFHPLASTTVGLYIGFPFGRLDEQRPGQARQLLGSLVHSRGFGGAVADLGGELHWDVGPDRSEIAIALPPDAVAQVLSVFVNASKGLAPSEQAGPEDLLAEATLRRGIEDLFFESILERPAAPTPAAPSAPVDPNAPAPAAPGIPALPFDRVVVALVGDLDEAALSAAQSALGAGAAAGAVPQRSRSRIPPQKVIWTLREDAPTAGLFAWLLPGAGPAPAAWRGLAASLTRGPSAPLQSFLQQAPGRRAEAFCWTLGPDVVFAVYFEGASGEAPRFKTALLAALAALARGPVSADLQRAQGALSMDGQFAASTPLGMATLLGRAQLAGSVEQALYELEDAAALQASDLQQLAQRLDPQAMIAVGRGSAEEARALALPTPVPTPAPSATEIRNEETQQGSGAEDKP